MCGICGLVYNDAARPAAVESLAAMNAAMLHRGPDDEGFWTEGPVGLGHRRLSIIDLSPAGRQPMSNEDGSLRLVFNGEIYNFPELRQSCLDRGHRFHSHTDSEVLLHLYEDFGDAMLDRLNGMFAFALWDQRRRRLLLAVDRLGKKPLRYSQGPWGLAFASEVPPLLALPEVSRDVDERALWHYLTLGYIPAPMTGFREVHKLPAAHRMIYENGTVRLERYWQLDFSSKREQPEEAWHEEILALLEDAVKIRMISDVPLGAFLSGGVDSSAIVALMARHSSRPVRTFSIGFPEERFNELPAARAIAEMFSTEHREMIVRPSAMEILPKLVEAYAEPYADSSALPSYYLAQVTRQHVTVALNGDGGDENFAGYERYSLFETVERRTAPARALRLSPLFFGLARAAAPLNSRLAFRLNLAADLSSRHFPRRYLRFINAFDNWAKARLVSPAFLSAHAAAPTLELLERRMDEPFAGSHPLDRMMYFDIMEYLPYDLLVKVDVATMAHSLEGRSPLLDYRMLELSTRIPPALKLRNGEKKSLFKRALLRILPKEHLERPKMGFGIPIHDWFRGELKELAWETLTAPRVGQRGILRPEAVRRMLLDHFAGRSSEGVRIWTLLFLELWFRRFVDRQA